MANHKSAIKRIKQNSKQRSRNRYFRSTMRTQLKVLNAAIEEGNHVEERERERERERVRAQRER